MMKINKLITFALMGLASTSMTNQTQTIFLTGVDIETVGNYLYIRGRYSCTVNSSDRCIFAYKSKFGDGPYNSESSWTLENFTICENDPCVGWSSAIPVSKLCDFNYFGITMCPLGGMPGLTDKSILYMPFGKKEIKLYEKNNGRKITSGYYKQKWNSVEPSMNYNEEDIFTFYNFEESIVGQVYNYIDLSTLKFKYSDGYNTNNLKAKCRLDFYDAHNVFPNFPLLDDSMYRYINLDTFVDEEGYLRFKNKDDLYYNSTTHEPSATFIEGYAKTDKLYLPKDKYQNLKKMHFRINMDVTGYTKFKVYGEYDVSFSRKIFGDCSDSEYCTYINEDNSYNVLEKEVVVNI